MFNFSKKRLVVSSFFIASYLLIGCGGGVTNNTDKSIYQDRNIDKFGTVIVQAPLPENSTGITINELLVANANINLDPDFYQFSDWIELYNSKNTTVDISGFYLSDDKTNPTKYKIPSGTTIASHEYILIWADEKNSTKKAIHTNFKLSHKGEHLILCDKSENIIDILEFGKQDGDISCVRVDNSIVYMKPTPKALNLQTYMMLKRAKKPSFSPKSGGYSSTQTIILTQENDANIYYTIDGSTPTLENAILYKKPIQVNHTTVIRAISVGDGLVSKTRSQTYFINHDSSIPIVSLKTDAKYLFDDMLGIYVEGKNGTPYIQCKPRKDEVGEVNYAQEWKRPVHFEYFDSTQNDAFSLSLDFEITGQCSRFFDKKSFAFELDSKYDDKSLKYKLFPDKDVVKFKDFKLRAGNYGYELGDILAAAIVENGKLNIDYQAYQAVQMFMNGKFWGVYNLREKKGKDYLKSNYPDIDKNNLDIISTKAKHGDKADYKKLMNYVKNHDLSQDIHYQEVLKSIDIENYIDYMIIMIYSANTDWLDSNFRCWKEKRAGSKWRWMLDDVDHGFKSYLRRDEIYQNTFDVLENNGQTTLLEALFVQLSENDIFKTKFKKRFNDLLDSLFSPENMLDITTILIDERKEDISKGRFATEQKKFDTHAERILHFVQKRRDVVKKQLSKF